MGLRERLQGIRQYMSSPISVSMAELGSDAVVHPGQTATVRVKVEGADDGTVQGIDLELRSTLTGLAGPQGKSFTRHKTHGELQLAPSAAIGAGEQLELPFELAIPEDVPPTVASGGAGSVSWQLRVRVGTTTAWRTVGLLDPQGRAGNRNHRGGSSLWIFFD